MRAVERLRPLGAAPLAVGVDPAAPPAEVEALAQMIRGSGLLQLEVDLIRADVALRWAPAEASPPPALPPLPVAARPRWLAMRGPTPLLRPIWADRADAHDQLVQGLERAAAAARLAALTPPVEAGLRLEIALLRGDASGNFTPLKQDDPEGLPVLYQGERLAFTLTNASSVPLSVSVLNLGLLGDVSLVYVSEPIGPGGVDAGFARQGGAELGFPSGFQRLIDDAGQPRDRGLDGLVAIGTTSPADLSALEQEGYRGVTPGRAPEALQQLLCAAMSGRRDLLRVRAPVRDGWTVARASWLLMP